MAFKMKGSPMKRNFNIGSALKHPGSYGGSPEEAKKNKAKHDATFVEGHTSHSSRNKKRNRVVAADKTTPIKAYGKSAMKMHDGTSNVHTEKQVKMDEASGDQKKIMNKMTQIERQMASLPRNSARYKKLMESHKDLDNQLPAFD